MTSGAILVKEKRERRTNNMGWTSATHPPNPHTHTPPSHTHRQEAMDHYTTHCRNADIYITHMQILTHSLTKMVYPQMSWLVMKMPQTQSQLQERIEEQHSLTSLNYSQSYYKYIKLSCSPSFTIPLSVRRMLPAFTSLCILLLSWR